MVSCPLSEWLQRIDFSPQPSPFFVILGHCLEHHRIVFSEDCFGFGKLPFEVFNPKPVLFFRVGSVRNLCSGLFQFPPHSFKVVGYSRIAFSLGKLAFEVGDALVFRFGNLVEFVGPVLHRFFVYHPSFSLYDLETIHY